MRKLTLIFVFLLVLVPFVSASQIELNKQEFDSGETLLATISGSFVDPVTRDNVNFYRSNVKIPVEYELQKINDEYYIYALLLGKSEGNYSLEIENVRYYKGLEITDQPFSKFFNISNKTSDFSVTPGIVLTQNSFSIELQNLQEKKILVSVSYSNGLESDDGKTEIELKSGEKKSLKFSLISLGSREDISFSSENTNYDLPVFTISGSDQEENTFLQNKGKLKFKSGSIEVSMATNSEGKRIVYLENSGDEEIENISIESSEDLNLFLSFFPETISELKPNESIKVEVDINSGEEDSVFEGRVFARAENLTASFLMTLNFTKDFIPEDGQTPEDPSTRFCLNAGGDLCTDNQICEGEIFYAEDGRCCLGICSEEKSSSNGKLIGWGLLLIILIAAFWFYKAKYKKAG